MKNKDRNKQSQGDERRNAIKNNPEHVVNNPAYQYSGRSTDNMGLNHPDNTAGGGLANSNYDEKTAEQGLDFNRAGNLKNTSNNELRASKNVDYNDARPVDKLSGKEGKTMVKNVGWHENNELNNADENNENKIQGQQQGGNHGGGGLKGGKFGNQTKPNSSRTHQKDMDGDFPGGRKGKK